MGTSAEQKEAKRLAKEAKKAAKEQAKRYKAWCRLLKSKDESVVQAACADNARDFEFLRGPGLASLLKLLKNKNALMSAAAVKALANFVDPVVPQDGEAVPELEATADLPPQVPLPSDGSLVMQAGLEKGATWQSIEGLLAMLRKPRSVDSQCHAARVVRAVIQSVVALPLADKHRALYLANLFAVDNPIPTLVALASAAVPSEDGSQGKVEEDAAPAPPVVAECAVQALAALVAEVAAARADVMDTGVAATAGQAARFIHRDAANFAIRDMPRHPHREELLQSLADCGAFHAMLRLATSPVAADGDGAAPGAVSSAVQAAAVALVQACTWNAGFRSHVRAARGFPSLIQCIATLRHSLLPLQQAVEALDSDDSNHPARRKAFAVASQLSRTIDAAFRMVADGAFACDLHGDSVGEDGVTGADVRALVDVLVKVLRVPYLPLKEHLTLTTLGALRAVVLGVVGARAVVASTGVMSVLVRLTASSLASGPVRDAAEHMVHVLAHRSAALDGGLAARRSRFPGAVQSHHAPPQAPSLDDPRAALREGAAAAADATEAAGDAEVAPWPAQLPTPCIAEEPAGQRPNLRVVPHVTLHADADARVLSVAAEGEQAPAPWLRVLDLVRALRCGAEGCPEYVDDPLDAEDGAPAAGGGGGKAKGKGKAAKGKGKAPAPAEGDDDATAEPPLPPFLPPSDIRGVPLELDTRVRAARLLAALSGSGGAATAAALVEAGCLPAVLALLSDASAAVLSASADDAQEAAPRHAALMEGAVLSAEVLAHWLRTSPVAVEAAAAEGQLEALVDALLSLGIPAAVLRDAGVSVGDCPSLQPPLVAICRQPTDAPSLPNASTAVHVSAAALDALTAAAECDVRFRVFTTDADADAGGKAKAAKGKGKGGKGKGKGGDEDAPAPRVGLDADRASTSIGDAIVLACSRHVRLLVASLHHPQLTTECPAGSIGGKAWRTLVLGYVHATLSGRGVVERTVAAAVAGEDIAAGVLGVAASEPASVEELLPKAYWPVLAGDAGHKEEEAEAGNGEADEVEAADRAKAAAVVTAVQALAAPLLALVRCEAPTAEPVETVAATRVLRALVRDPLRCRQAQPAVRDTISAALLRDGALVDLVTLLDPAPTPLTEEEEAAIRIQSIARGRRSRKLALRRHPKPAVTVSPPVQLDGSAEETAAALRIQAISRGRRSRAEVRKLREERGLEPSGATFTPAPTAADGTEQLEAVGGADGDSGADAASVAAALYEVDEPAPEQELAALPDPPLLFVESRLNESDAAAFKEEVAWLVHYLVRRGCDREEFWVVQEVAGGDGEEATTVGRRDPNAGPTADSWLPLLNLARTLPRYNTSQCTALHAAVIGGADDSVAAMLSAGVDPNVSLNTGLSPLMSALLHGYEDIASQLLAAGADVDAENQDGDSVLKFAFLCPSADRALAFTQKHESQRGSAATPLPFPSVYASPAQQAACAGDAGAAAGASVADADRRTLRVPGSVRLVRLLLEAGADPNVSDDNGNFPLHWAVAGVTVRAALRSVKCFVTSEGGDKSSKGKKKQPQAGARSKSDELVAALLTAGARADAVNKRGRTPLHNALLAGRVENALNMLAAGADPNVADYDGNVSLHFACLGRGAASLDALAAANPDAPWAAHGRAGVVAALLDSGEGRPVLQGKFADERKGLSKDEKRLLELRAVLASGFEAVVAPASLTQRVCTRADLLNRLNAKGIAPLHVACGAHFTGDAQWRTADDGTDLSDFDAVAMEEAIASRSVIVAFLAQEPAVLVDITSPQLRGRRPLHWLASTWHAFHTMAYGNEVAPDSRDQLDGDDFESFLRSYHQRVDEACQDDANGVADTESKQSGGRSPSAAADAAAQLLSCFHRVNESQTTMLRSLLDAGADINAVDWQTRAGEGGPRFSPLHYALFGSGQVLVGADDEQRDMGVAAAWALLRAGAKVLPATANPPVTHLAAARGVSWPLMAALLRRGSRELDVISRAILSAQRAQSATWRKRAALGLTDDGPGGDECSTTAEQQDLEGVGAITSGMVNLTGQALDSQRRNLGTALHHAAQHGHAHLVSPLVEVPGVFLDAVRPHTGRTALHLAAFGGHVAAVEALVVAGADMSVRDNDGETMLVSAIRGNNPTLTITLLPLLRRLPGALEGPNAAGAVPRTIARDCQQAWAARVEALCDDEDAEVRAELEDEAELASRLVEILDEELGDSDDE